MLLFSVAQVVSALLLGLLPPVESKLISLKSSEAIDCEASYSKRNYLCENYDPVLLLSPPGSGNTWMRLLLEYSLGIYTGSVYSDSSLYDVLPGEKFCSQNQSGDYELYNSILIRPYSRVVTNIYLLYRIPI